MQKQQIMISDVNRIPGPEKLPKTKFQSTQKFLRDSKNYSGKETVKKKKTGPIQNIKRNINTAKMAESGVLQQICKRFAVYIT